MQDETIGLFFFLDWYSISLYEMKTDNWSDFSKRYDEINAGEQEFDYWQNGWLLDNLADNLKSQKYNRRDLAYIDTVDGNSTPIHISKFGPFSLILISFGRIKYPYGLNEDHRKVYQQVLTEDINNPEETRRLINELVGTAEERGISFEDDGVLPEELDDKEIIEALEIAIEVWGSEKLFVPEVINLIIRKMEIGFFGEFADRFLTKTNIDQFLQAAITVEKTQVTAFLLDYKNKNFPVEGKQI